MSILIEGLKSKFESRAKFQVDRSIVIVRNPYEALLAEFNRHDNIDRVYGGHHSIRAPEDFKREWPQFLNLSRLNDWGELYKAWARDKAPSHVLVYSRMMADLGPELDRVFQFLNHSGISPNIRCVLQSSEGEQHRDKHDWQKPLATFTNKQVQALNKAIDQVQHALEKKTGQNLDDFQLWKR